MRTRRNLWLGFGTLLAVLVVTLLGVTAWLRTLAGDLRAMTAKAEPASSAAYEMGIRNASTGLGVLNYLHTGAAGYRQQVRADAEMFQASLKQYARLAPDERELVDQVGAVYGEYLDLGEDLMARRDADGARDQELGRNLAALLNLLEAEVEAIDAKRGAEEAQLRALLDLRAGLSEVGTWLGAYRRTMAQDDKDRLLAATRAVQNALAGYDSIPLPSAGRAFRDEFARQLEEALTTVAVETESFERQQQDLLRFFYLRLRLGTLLDQGVGKLARSDLAAAGRSARQAIRSIQFTAAALLVAGLVISIATGLLVSRGILRTEETLRVTLTSIGDAVIATDRADRVTFMNVVAERLTGWTQPAAAGRPLSEILRLVSEDTREPIAGPTAAVIRAGAAEDVPGQALLIARDGTERPIDDSAAPIFDDQGKVVGAVLVFRDSSQRRRAEEALREADRRKDEFLAMLAHELRNPLAPLRNALYVIRTPNVDDATTARMLDMMQRQLDNLSRMIDDLLDVSRITRGKIELRMEHVDLAALVERVVDSARPEFAGAGRRLVATTPAQPVPVEVDSTRIEQIVGNLLSNALKYTRAGGRAWVAVEAVGGEAVVSVRDDGVGIEPAMLSRVFDLFEQGDNTFTRSQGGLGIGLTLVRHLVEMHAGRVEARSGGAGQGAEFVVRFPLAGELPASTAEEHPRQPAAADGDNHLRVLIVDDNADSADSLASFLGLRGYEVHTACDGHAALETARSLDPDMILLDIGLPGIDGYEVARQLRATLGLRHAVLVAMTGYGQESDKSRSRAAGFQHHLVKPVDLSILEDLLRQAAHRSSPATDGGQHGAV